MGPFRIIKWMEDDGRTIKNIYQNLIKTNQPENYSSSFQLVSALGSKKSGPRRKISSMAWVADQRIVDLSGPILEYVWLITQLAFGHMIKHWYTYSRKATPWILYHTKTLYLWVGYTPWILEWIYVLTLQITGLGWIGWTWDPGATTRFLHPFLNKQLRPRVTQLPMVFPSSSRNQQQRFPRCSAPTETVGTPAPNANRHRHVA